MVLASVGLALAACRGQRARAGVATSETTPPAQVCDPRTCIEDRAIGEPIVVGPGKIRVLVTNSRSAAAPSSSFRIVEVDEAGFGDVAKASCPTDCQPQCVGLVSSGETAVFCHCPFAERSFLAVVNAASGSVGWRDVPMPTASVSRVTSVRSFADLGDGQLALVLRVSGTKGAAAPGSAILLVPGPSPEVPLGSAARTIIPIATFVLDAKLHVLFRDDQYSEIVLARDGSMTTRDPLDGATLAPASMPRPCVSAAKDGTVIVSLPVGRTQGQTSVATLRYPGAFLPQGPESYPAESALCAAFDARAGVRGTRATLGGTWIRVHLVYEGFDVRRLRVIRSSAPDQP